MNVAELRIGNLVLKAIAWQKESFMPIIFSDNAYKVDSIGFYDVSLHDFPEYKECCEVVLNNISGIPLTEEWLVKFGATSKNYDYELGYIKYDREASDYGCECEKSNFWIVPNGDDDYYRIPIKLEYVHDLQNLYFELYRKELTLK